MLNQDVLIKILSYLPQYDKVNSSLVCKEWYDFNKYIFHNQCIKVSSSMLNTTLFKNWFQKHKCLIHDTDDTNYIDEIPDYTYNYIVFVNTGYIDKCQLFKFKSIEIKFF